MSDPKPTPPPRNRKARRKSSPGQVAFLEYKAVRDKAKAEREAKQRQDAHYLQTHYPEIAKAKRAKGNKNNSVASAWRRHSFVESFADWPSVLTAEEMGYRIREWLRDRSVLNPKTGRRKWKWRGCEKHFVKTEASVRKKLTELEVFRYNFRERRYFKCGAVEEAEATQRLAERTEEERLKRLKHTRAPADWHHFIPDDLKPTMCGVLTKFNLLPDGHQLDDLSEFGLLWVREEIRSLGSDWILNNKLRARRERLTREMAEAVLVAD
jgi:hypothetical protein